MFEHVQIIKDRDQARFAVIPYEEYVFLQELLNDRDKLADYLDYLHIQTVKGQSLARLSMAEVKASLEIDK